MEKSEATRMLSGLRNMLHTGIFSDVTLVGRDGIEFKAHKSVLWAESLVFGSMFGGTFKEAEANIVELDDDPEALTAMLYHIYQSSYLEPLLKNKSPKRMTSVVAAYAIADKYDVPRMRSLALEDLAKFLDPAKDIEDYISAVKAVEASTSLAIEDSELWAVVIESVRKHIGVLRKTAEFKALMVEMPALNMELHGLLQQGKGVHQSGADGYVPFPSTSLDLGGGRRLG